jgi:hypothetical protein
MIVARVSGDIVQNLVAMATLFPRICAPLIMIVMMTKTMTIMIIMIIKVLM